MVKKNDQTGGDLVSDLKNLAVPFAILLAKQGIVNVFDKKNPVLNSIVQAPRKVINSAVSLASPGKKPKTTTKSKSNKKKVPQKGGSLGTDMANKLFNTAMVAQEKIQKMSTGGKRMYSG